MHTFITLLIGIVGLVPTTPMIYASPIGVSSLVLGFAWEQEAPVDYFVLCLDDQPFASCPTELASDGLTSDGQTIDGSYQSAPAVMAPGPHTFRAYACLNDPVEFCSDPGVLTFHTGIPSPLANLRAVGGG